MSNVEDYPAEHTMCSADVAVAAEPDIELLHPREVRMATTGPCCPRPTLPNARLKARARYQPRR